MAKPSNIPPWQVTRGVVGGSAGRLLSLDPGHTTGWAWWEDGELESAGQQDTSPDGAGLLGLVDLFDLLPDLPTYVVSERYAIYPDKIDQHVLSSVYTLQVIGAIRLLCILDDIPWREQGAGEAKRFCSSDRLRSWGMWQRSAPHANDAIRHGAYFLTFRKD